MAKGKTNDEEVSNFSLPQEVVVVKPNFHNPGWIKNPRHAAFFKIEGTHDTFTCAMDRNGKVKNPFSKAAKAYLEDVLDIEENDLSVYKKGSMIRTTTVRLGKDPVKFDLSDPLDYFNLQILLTNSDLIAPSIKDVKKKGTYKYYVERETEVNEVNKAQADVNLVVYGFYGKNQNNKLELSKALRAYSQFTAKPAKKIDKNSKLDFLQGQFLSIVSTDAKKLAQVLSDENYDTLTFIGSAVDAGALVRKKNRYFLEGGIDEIASNLREAIAYLDNPANQELRLMIEEKVKKY